MTPAPLPVEGFDHLHRFTVAPKSPMILKRARDSPAVTSEICSRTASFRGNLNRGSRRGWKNPILALFVKHSEAQPSRDLSGGYRGTSTCRVPKKIQELTIKEL